jgi:IclR family negative regulator of allantoin and glyoxylate utilization operon
MLEKCEMAEVKKRGRPSQPGSGSQKGAQALERGIAVLNYLAQSGGSSSVSNIAENLSLPLSTTFRLLKVLEEADFVYQDAQLSWWHIGLQAFTVGSSYIHNRDVLSVAAPYMQRLMLLSGETANLAIRNGFEAVLIGQRECQSMVRMCAPLGSRLPLHASGAGKALLYSLDDEALMSLMMQAGLKNFTTHTLDNLNALKKDLQHARQQGFAQDSEEHVTGLNCLASAIFDSNNNAVAAISISGPSSRLTTERFTDLGELVRDTARDISLALGQRH